MTQGKEEDRAHEGKHLEHTVAHYISRVHHHAAGIRRKISFKTMKVQTNHRTQTWTSSVAIHLLLRKPRQTASHSLPAKWYKSSTGSPLQLHLMCQTHTLLGRSSSIPAYSLSHAKTTPSIRDGLIPLLMPDFY